MGIEEYGKEGNEKGERGERFEDGSLFLEPWTTETQNPKSWTNVVAEKAKIILLGVDNVISRGNVLLRDAGKTPDLLTKIRVLPPGPSEFQVTQVWAEVAMQFGHLTK